MEPFEKEEQDVKSNTNTYNENIPGPTQYDDVPQPQRTSDEKSATNDNGDAYAIVAMIAGIASLFFLVCLPILGIFLAVLAAIVGIVFGVMGKKSKQRTFAIAGLVVSIIALAFTVIAVILVAIFGAAIIQAIMSGFTAQTPTLPYYYFR